jgi:glycosyltransferase involved in cell wall biosynthesis
MRVLLGVHAFLPRSTAGVEVYTYRLAQALLERGHEVLVLAATHDLSRRHGETLQDRVGHVAVARVVNLHRAGTLRATYADPQIDAAVNGVFRRFGPDVLHLQHLLNLSTGLLWEAARVGVPVLLTLHDYWLSCPRDGLRMQASGEICHTVDHDICAHCMAESPYLVPKAQRVVVERMRSLGLGRMLHSIHDAFPRFVERVLRGLRAAQPISRGGLAIALDARAEHIQSALERIDLVIAPTRFIAERAAEVGVRADRLRVLPHGAVVESARVSVTAPRRRIAYVGTLAPHKGIHILIEAFLQLSGSELSLDIYGDPSIRPEYSEDLVRSAAGDSRIRFRGGFPEGDQVDVLSGIDVLVVPSLWWENSPLTILEARAAGVAVVASQIGGIPELLDGVEAARLVPPGDALKLREALRELVEDKTARHTSQRPKTVSEGAVELERLYASVLGARERPS